MPELPECERSRRAVEDHALDRTVAAVELGEVSHMDLPGEADRARLTGRQFTRTRRHGKAIFAGSASGPWIAVGLGMTGSLRPWDAGDDAPDHVRLTFVFEGDRRLGFRNPRKFGTLEVIDDPDTWIEARGLGPDAAEIGAEAFARAVGGTRGAVKSALMAQKKLAGLGNLWSDETLFAAGIAPEAKGTDLSEAALERLHAEMGRVLSHLLKVNADYAEIPGDWLFPSRTDGADCPRCDGTIRKSRVSGRSAYACDRHQEAA